MAQDITKDVIGCREFEVQKLNQSGESAEFFGDITDDNHIVNKKYVDDAIAVEDLWDRTGTNTYLKNSGDKVGIGTSSPDKELEVSNATGAATIRLTDADYGRSTDIIQDDSNLLFQSSGAGGSVRWKDSAANSIMTVFIGSRRFGINTGAPTASVTGVKYSTYDLMNLGSTTAGEYLTVKNDGKVGIGTTNPQKDFHVNGTIRMENPTKNQTAWQCTNSLNNSSLSLYEDNNSHSIFAIYDNANAIHTRFYSNGPGYTCVNGASGQNFGISTTTPNAKLQVVGDTHMGADTTNYTEIKADGEINLHGTARVKKEFGVALSDFNPGASGPTATLHDIFPTYEFTLGDDMHTSFELPTDWEAGTDIEIEVYWAIDEAYADNNGEVRWSADWRAVAAGEVISAGASGTCDFGDVNIPATANTVVKTECSISGASLSQDDLIAFNGSRVALVDGNNPSAEPYIVAVRVEYTANKLGEAL